MNITTIDATISNERQNADVVGCIKENAILMQSTEFRCIADRAVLKLGDAQQLDEFLINALAMMALFFRLGYKVKEQEIASQELEALLGETAAEIPEGIRATINKAAKSEKMRGVPPECE